MKKIIKERIKDLQLQNKIFNSECRYWKQEQNQKTIEELQKILEQLKTRKKEKASEKKEINALFEELVQELFKAKTLNEIIQTLKKIK